MWTFGGILSFMLVAQILTGIVLVMHYTAMPIWRLTASSTSCAM
jgi:quinol-cytochrome oxidoreductase complex cytochrome b subunit